MALRKRFLHVAEDSAAPLVQGDTFRYDTTTRSLRKAVESGPTAINEVAATGAAEQLTTAAVQDITLTAASVAITMPDVDDDGAYRITLIVRQDDAGAREATWPATVHFPGGNPPTISVAADAVDVIDLLTVDGGDTWLGTVRGQALAT